MKKIRKILLTITFFMICLPSFVFAKTNITSLVNQGAIIQTSTISTPTNNINNLSMIIIAMIISIIFLIGIFLFSPKNKFSRI